MTTNKIQIKVKNKNLNPLYTFITRLRAKRLGLKTNKIESKNNKFEMEFEGNKANLWKMLRKLKRSSTLSPVEEVHFEFVQSKS